MQAQAHAVRVDSVHAHISPGHLGNVRHVSHQLPCRGVAQWDVHSHRALLLLVATPAILRRETVHLAMQHTAQAARQEAQHILAVARSRPGVTQGAAALPGGSSVGIVCAEAAGAVPADRLRQHSRR